MSSILYSLQPIGVGSSNVESLASYITRLANAHHLRVRDLMRYVILPLMYEQSQRLSLTQSWWSFASYGINGFCSWETSWTKSIEYLTAQEKLHCLNMSAWSEILPAKGLLKAHCTWCPYCLQEWVTKRQIIHYPLLWQLSPVQVCLKHFTYLKSQCPNPECNSSFLPLTRQSVLGYCSTCHCWLGETYSKRHRLIQTSDDLITTAHWVGDLIALTPQISVETENWLRHAICQLIDVQFSGNASALANTLGVHHKTIYEWCKGTQYPQLEKLARIGRIFGISPKQLLLEEPNNWIHDVVNNSVPVSQDLDTKTTFRKLDKRFMQAKLEELYDATEDQPISLAAVGRELRYDPTFLRNHFPEICEKIVRRFQNYRAEKARLRRDLELERFRQHAMKLEEEGIYLSYKRLRPSTGRALANPEIRAIRNELLQ